MAYLGHIISADGVSMDEDKVIAIQTWHNHRQQEDCVGSLDSPATTGNSFVILDLSPPLSQATQGDFSVVQGSNHCVYHTQEGSR